MRLHRTQQIREAPLRRWCRSYQRCWSASQTRLNCSAGRKECKGAPSTCDFEDRAGGLRAFVVSVGRPGAMLMGTVAPGKKNRHVAVFTGTKCLLLALGQGTCKGTSVLLLEERIKFKFYALLLHAHLHRIEGLDDPVCIFQVFNGVGKEGGEHFAPGSVTCFCS
jgi:hypothetical protein